MYELDMDQEGNRVVFTARESGRIVGQMTAVLHDKHAVLHNEIHVWSRGMVRVYREMFRDIRGVLQELGVQLVIPCSDRYDRKMERFWRLMGFECFGSIEADGTTVHYAVMEA